MHVSHVTVEKRGTSHLLLVFVRIRGHPCFCLVPVQYQISTIYIDTLIGIDTRYFRRKFAQNVKAYRSTESIMLISCK